MGPPTLPTWTPAAGKLTDVALGAEKSGAVCTARLGQTSTTESMASRDFSLPLRTHRLLCKAVEQWAHVLHERVRAAAMHAS